MKTNRAKPRNILVIHDSDASSSRRIVTGALKGIAEHPDWSPTALNYHNAGFLESVRLLNRAAPFDGVIVESPVPLTKALLSELPNAQIICATAAEDSYSHPSCIVDNKAIAAAAAEALLRLGCRAFAYVGASELPFTRFHSDERARHFCKALQAAGSSAQTILIDNQQLAQFLADLPKPAGIFAYNDRIAAALLKAIRSLRLKVPDQIAIIGVDNDPDICTNTHPALSSIDLDFESAGLFAVKLLEHEFSGRKSRLRMVFGFRGVVHRESTTSSKTGGRTIARAREIIRQNYARRLTLNSIAGELRISPRLLSLRFREITGHTVHDEIAQTRLEAAKSLLQNSSEPVKTIAAACGYPTLQNFYRHFKRRYGNSPADAFPQHRTATLARSAYGFEMRIS